MMKAWLVAGALLIAAVFLGRDTAQAINTGNCTPASNPCYMISIGSSSGASSNYHVIATAGDNHANIKNGAGTVFGIDGTALAAAQYIRLYNAASGFNSCNSSSNLIWGQQVPNTNSGFVIPLPTGIAFSTGISICITGGGAVDNDTTAATTTTVVNVRYN
jgi:hypothetical protein